MNNFLSQLNLTPQERRIVVAIFLVVITVLNLLFVWPHFHDWKRINQQLDDLRGTEAKFNRAITQDRDPTNGWAVQVLKKAKQQGGSVAESTQDPQNQLTSTIRAQERKTGVYVDRYTAGAVKTNEFFEEHSISISFESEEQQLVSFLWDMGNDPAMIRVAKLNLNPADANRYKLKGNITLTANYAKQAAPTATAAKSNPAAGPMARAQAAAEARKPAGPRKADNVGANRHSSAPAPKPPPFMKPHPPGGPPSFGPNNQPMRGPNASHGIPALPNKRSNVEK